jgi:hypothetical protein
MKIQNIIRMQAMVLGVGAALLLASSVRAQEIENSSFNDGPNMVAIEQQAPASAATNSTVAAVDSTAMVSPAAPMMTQEAAVSVLAPVQISLLAFLALCIALYAAHGVVEAKRLRRNLTARTGTQLHG